MKYPLSQIKIGHRQRTEYSGVDELADSIKRLGQFHQIGLRTDGTLVWGYHRVMAAQQLGWTDIEAIVRDDLTEDMAYECELEEDIRRKSRTWQEEVIAVGNLFYIKARRARQDGETFGVREMSQYTSFGKSVVANYVYTMSNALTKEPKDEQLWACENYSGALELLRQREETAAYQEMQSRRAAIPLGITVSPLSLIMAGVDAQQAITQVKNAGSVHIPDPTPAKPLSLRDRALAYNTAFSHLWNQQLICFTNPKAPVEQYLLGHWFVGGGNISTLYGSYQIEYLRRIVTLFPDIVGKQEIVHLFSGSIPVSDSYTVVGLPDHDNVPDVVCDAHALSSGLGFSPRLIYADPPYSVEDSEHYANAMVNRERVLAECAIVLQPGGFVVWLDQALPIFSSNNLELVGAISYIRSTGNRFRVISIFRKPLCQLTLSTPPPPSPSPSQAEPSPTPPLPSTGC
jgi:hypothetical protein